MDEWVGDNGDGDLTEDVAERLHLVDDRIDLALGAPVAPQRGYIAEGTSISAISGDDHAKSSACIPINEVVGRCGQTLEVRLSRPVRAGDDPIALAKAHPCDWCEVVAAGTAMEQPFADRLVVLAAGHAVDPGVELANSVGRRTRPGTSQG
ncbi:MAG: hypothetical protein ACYC61_09570 [Isosphaeraceae bacterium]